MIDDLSLLLAPDAVVTGVQALGHGTVCFVSLELGALVLPLRSLLCEELAVILMDGRGCGARAHPSEDVGGGLSFAFVTGFVAKTRAPPLLLGLRASLYRPNQRETIAMGDCYILCGRSGVPGLLGRRIVSDASRSCFRRL